MIDRNRRALFGGLALAAIADDAQACSLVARQRPVGFSETAALRSLRALVTLINDAPRLTDEMLAERAGSWNFDDSVSDPLLNYAQPAHPIENTTILRAWGTADGKPDRTPIRLIESNLLKERGGIALYQFTLRRDQYHAADPEGCNGLFVHGEYYGPEDAAYLGTLRNNVLRDIRAFPEWLQTL